MWKMMMKMMKRRRMTRVIKLYGTFIAKTHLYRLFLKTEDFLQGSTRNFRREKLLVGKIWQSI